MKNNEGKIDNKITTNMVEGIYNNIIKNLRKLSKPDINFTKKEFESIEEEFTKVFENTKINGDDKGNKTKELDIKDTLELFDNINIFLNSALKSGETNKLRELLVSEFTEDNSERDIKTLISAFNKSSAFDKYI
jgi:hypothetical protein